MFDKSGPGQRDFDCIAFLTDRLRDIDAMEVVMVAVGQVPPLNLTEEHYQLGRVQIE